MTNSRFFLDSCMYILVAVYTCISSYFDHIKALLLGEIGRQRLLFFLIKIKMSMIFIQIAQKEVDKINN